MVKPVREGPRYRLIDPETIYRAPLTRVYLPDARLFLKNKKPRVARPRADEVIVLLGLSPWSSYPNCDICASNEKAMARHGIDPTSPVIAYGMYAAHAQCYDMHPDLTTMRLPALDYQALWTPIPEKRPPSPYKLLDMMAAKLRMKGLA